jgi:hypothetical protein
MPPVFKRVSDGQFRYRPAGVDTQITNFPNALLVTTNTDTGAQNNWAPALSSHTLIEWSGASDIAITGLAGGSAGQIVTLKNTGTKIATFAHASGSSSAANRFTNQVTSAATPVAAGGFITYIHDGTNWVMHAHEQGAWIRSTYASGDFGTNGSGMTWTVQSGDRTGMDYKLSGRTLVVYIEILLSSITAPLSSLLSIASTQYGGFTWAAASANISAPIITNDAGTPGTGRWTYAAGATQVLAQKSDASNWTASVNLTSLYGILQGFVD